jgi:ribosomal protein L29
MTDVSRLNEYSWELASLAMLNENGNLQPYSVSQVRKAIAATLSEDSMERLQKLRSDYNPAPPQGKRPEQSRHILNNKREKNNAFIQRLIEIIRNNDRDFVQQLSQYIFWNIKILEQKEVMGKLKLLLECEGIDKSSITGKIKNIAESGQGPRKSYTRDNRKPSKGARRF